MRTAAAVVVASASLLAVPVGASAAGANHAVQQCKNDGHKYIHIQVAGSHGNGGAKIIGGALRFHPCGEDDGHFTRLHHRITLIITSTTKITIFKTAEDPSDTKTVSAANFPNAEAKRTAEPFYEFTGPHSGLKTLTEHFVS